MKKLYLLLIILCFVKGFGQSYSFDFYHGNGNVNVTIRSYSWVFKNNNSIIDSFSKSGYIPSNEYSQITYPAITAPLNSTFYLSVTSDGSANLDGGSYTCDNNNTTDSISLDDLIVEGYHFQSCGMTLYSKNFKPNNLTITNNTGPSLCSGEQLDLVGSSGFPNVVYHWQYSLYDTVTSVEDEEGYVTEYREKYWIDVPTDKSNNPTTSFTIEELLGNIHQNYFNKQIYFRIGYGQNRPFTEPLAITYSPCAPEIHLVDAPNPLCNESPIPDVTISFKRDLKNGELLKYLCIVKSTDDASILYQHPSDINHFEGALPYKTFTITGLSTLENSGSYRIKYQAFEGTVNKGIQYSEPFTYTIPTPIKYAIDNWTQPSCFGSNDGSIEIQVSGATAPYNFYKDNVKITPAIENGKYYLRGLTAKSEGYKIIVTDKNGCYEKK